VILQLFSNLFRESKHQAASVWKKSGNLFQYLDDGREINMIEFVS
jgi:hypothetical protein